MEEKPYLKYAESIKKLITLTKLSHVLCILSTLALLFMPIFSYKIDTTGIVIETGNFNVFGELYKNIQGSVSGDSSSFVGFFMIMLSFIVILLSVIFLMLEIKTLINLSQIKDVELFTMQTYNNAFITKGSLFWRTQRSIKLPILYALFFAFGKILTLIFANTGELYRYTHMVSASVSLWIIPAFVLIATGITLSIIIRKLDVNICQKIINEKISKIS